MYAPALRFLSKRRFGGYRHASRRSSGPAGILLATGFASENMI